MMSGVDHDLLIVGGGPSGVATALFLAHAAPHLRGRIAVAERRTYPREKICAGAIGGRADRALASIGVRVDVPSAPLRGVSIETPAGRMVHRRAEPIGRVVRRGEFDASLAATAKERGVRFLEAHRVTKIERRSDRVRVEFEGEGGLEVRAVVGADGVGSLVRRELGLGHGSLVAQAVETDTRPAGSDPDDDLMHFDVSDGSLRGYAWDFPTIVGGERLCCRGVYELLPERGASSRPEAKGPERGPDVAARLASYLDKRGVSHERERFRRFAERGLSLHEAIAKERVLLVGEAAGIDPILGEGIAQAVLYGKVAGPYLARCIEGSRYDFLDWPRTLRSSVVGWDLTVRTWLAPWLYGRARGLAERFVARCVPFASAGLEYFAGDRVSPEALVRSVVGLGREVLS